MAKEIRRKTDFLVENIKRGVDVYLSRNFEIYGISHVVEVIASADGKRADVYVNFSDEDKTPRCLNAMNANRKAINEAILEAVRVKYLPKLNFKGMPYDEMGI